MIIYKAYGLYIRLPDNWSEISEEIAKSQAVDKADVCVEFRGINYKYTFANFCERLQILLEEAEKDMQKEAK